MNSKPSLPFLTHPLYFRDAAVAAVPLPNELFESDPLTIADVGASGGLVQPWASLDDHLGPLMKVYAFEPNPEACDALRMAHPEWHVVEAALWSSVGTTELHLAVDRASSSVHPPSGEVLQRYSCRHGAPRAPHQTIQVPTTTLDEAVRGHRPADVIKLDTQGSEWDILSGSTASLAATHLVVLELWTAPVHSGQGGVGETLALLEQQGLEVFDIEAGGNWLGRYQDRSCMHSRRQVTQLDVLLLRRDELYDESASRRDILVAGLLRDLFGFSDRALQLLDSRPWGSPYARQIGDIRRHILRRRTRWYRSGLLGRGVDALLTGASRLGLNNLRPVPPLR